MVVDLGKKWEWHDPSHLDFLQRFQTIHEKKVLKEDSLQDSSTESRMFYSFLLLLLFFLFIPTLHSRFFLSNVEVDQENVDWRQRLISAFETSRGNIWMYKKRVRMRRIRSSRISFPFKTKGIQNFSPKGTSFSFALLCVFHRMNLWIKGNHVCCFSRCKTTRRGWKMHSMRKQEFRAESDQDSLSFGFSLFLSL